MHADFSKYVLTGIHGKALEKRTGLHLSLSSVMTFSSFIAPAMVGLLVLMRQRVDATCSGSLLMPIVIIYTYQQTRFSSMVLRQCVVLFDLQCARACPRSCSLVYHVCETEKLNHLR